MFRFVILQHDHPVLHLDFMLQRGDALRTWRLDHMPGPGDSVVAVPLNDHRLMYLDYEGPVSGGRGTVSRWDWGTYALTCDSSDELLLRLNGNRFSGTVSLRKQDGGDWLLSVMERDV